MEANKIYLENYEDRGYINKNPLKIYGAEEKGYFMNAIQYERKIFPQLSPYAARFGNFFFCFDTVCTFDFYGKNIQIRPLFDKKIDTCSFVLVLKIGTSTWKIAFQKDDILLFNPAIKNVDEIQENYASLFPPEVKQALLESVFTPVIKQCSQKLGMEITVDGVEFPVQQEDFSAYLAFAFEEKSESEISPQNIFYVQIPEEQQSLQVLAKLEQVLVPEKKDGQAISEVRLPLAFCVGQTELTVQDLQAVSLGDYILFDEYYPKNEQIRLYPCLYGQKENTAFGTGDYWLGNLKDKEIEIVEWISACHKQNEQETPDAGAQTKTGEDKKMEEKKAEENTQAGSEVSSPLSVENIAVNVQFSLAERMMSLQDLQSINAGYVFALENDFLAPVTLFVNGKSIGKGKIVDINGTVGVQVVEINK